MKKFFMFIRPGTALRAVAYVVVPAAIPAAWILGPFLPAVGFGSAGPIAGTLKRSIIIHDELNWAPGSAAAWMQSSCFGAAVGAGSWFSGLQAAGMGVTPMWVELAAKGPLVMGGAVKAFRLLKRRVK